MITTTTHKDALNVTIVLVSKARYHLSRCGDSTAHTASIAENIVFCFLVKELSIFLPVFSGRYISLRDVFFFVPSTVIETYGYINICKKEGGGPRVRGCSLFE
jgi:hypothetical protein